MHSATLRSATFNYALLRSGIALLAFAWPLAGGEISRLAEQSPLLSAYLGFALISLLTSLRRDPRRRQLLATTFFDAVAIGAALSAHASPLLLVASPLLMFGAKMALPRHALRQTIAQHLLALAIAWAVAGWHVPPVLQATLAGYLLSGAWMAYRPTRTGRTPGSRPAATIGSAPASAPPAGDGERPPQPSLPPAPDGRQHWLLLQGNARDSRSLADTLRGWGAHVEASGDLAELLALAYASMQDIAQPPPVVIVDQRDRSEAPAQLLNLFRDSPALASLRLILLTGSQGHGDDALLNAGYSAVLASPLDKTLLFNALHAPQPGGDSAGVTSLLDHYLRARNPLPPLEILLALPSQMQLKVHKRLLEREGHSVYVTGSGEQALDALTAHRFDLAMIHAGLPDMDGFELTRIYRLTHPGPQGTPVVMLAEQADGEMQQRCRHAGAQAMLGLPLQTESLRALQERLFATDDFAPGKSAALILSEHRAMHKLAPEILMELEQLGNGLGFVRELVDSFIDDSNRLLRDMRSAAHRLDLESFRDCAHALKGSAGSLGAARLQQYSLGLALLSPDELQSNGERLLQHLQELLREAHDALVRYIDKRQEQASRN